MTDPRAVPFLSADPAQLETRVRQMLTAGRPQAARPMLRVLRGLGAGQGVLAELEARLSMAEGHFGEAECALARALQAMPDIAGLHAARAEALLMLDNPAAALPSAADAMLLAPDATDAKALLGIILIEAGRPAEAVRCLAEAVDGEPANTSYRLAYAEALHRLDRPDDAAFVLEDGIRVLPQDLALRRAALMHAVRVGQFAQAAVIGAAARADWVVDAAVLGLLAHALGALGRHEEAFDAYADASRLDPADPYVRHLAAAGGSVPPGPCAPADYIRVVFDGYAERFDSHLLSLGYRVPGVMRSVIQQLGHVEGPVTDLGCGTGLLAVACDDLAGPWTGIDLSGAMLERARERGLYTRLVQGDIGTVLPDLPQAGLVLAGDVLCYFGDLDEVLLAVHRHLRPGGHAVVSLEEGDGDGHAIGPHGRFRHSGVYLRLAASRAGLDVAAVRQEVLRWEEGQPVAGLIVTLKAPA